MFSPAQRFNTRIAPKISIFLALYHSLRTSKLDSKIYLMTRYLSLSFCDRKETLLEILEANVRFCIWYLQISMCLDA